MKSVLVANQQRVMKVIRMEGGAKPACTFGGEMIFLKLLSRIRTVSTRKMMSYARIGRSLMKMRWRSEVVLTCKSLAEFWYRGEILIESSSCWFPSKFPPG